MMSEVPPTDTSSVCVTSSHVAPPTRKPWTRTAITMPRRGLRRLSADSMEVGGMVSQEPPHAEAGRGGLLHRIAGRMQSLLGEAVTRDARRRARVAPYPARHPPGTGAFLG